MHVICCDKNQMVFDWELIHRKKNIHKQNINLLWGNTLQIILKYDFGIWIYKSHPMLHFVLFVMFLRQHSVWERLLSRWRWWTSCSMCTCLPGYLVTCHPYIIRLTEMSDPVTGAPYLHHPELYISIARWAKFDTSILYKSVFLNKAEALVINGI